MAEVSSWQHLLATASAGSNGSDRTVVVAVIGASATIIVAILGAFAANLATKRERRRGPYSEAVKAAVGWKELLYRIRRRRDGQEAELIGRMHDLQDQISYYSAWVGSESGYMKRSYDKLVSGVKARTESLISQAWKDGVRPVPGNAIPDDQHPDLSDLIDTFLGDVRSHLSPWPWRRVAVARRNRKGR